MNVRRMLVGVAAFGLLVGLTGCSGLIGGSKPRSPDASITQSAVIDAFQLRVGDCLISAQLEGSFNEVPAVPCDEAHDSEVIKIFNLTGFPVVNATYDAKAIDAQAEEKCEQAMVDYVGPNYAEVVPELDYSWFNPTEASFAKGDREIDCVVYAYSLELDLTQSVKGLGA